MKALGKFFLEIGLVALVGYAAVLTTAAQVIVPQPDQNFIKVSIEKKEESKTPETAAKPNLVDVAEEDADEPGKRLPELIKPTPKAAPDVAPVPIPAQTPLPRYLKDRGTGIPTSMFGTYVQRHELLVYTFAEYYRDHNFEYKPEEFGFAGTGVDFRGKYRATEGLIFVAYGLTDNIEVEFEVATIKASIEKSPLDKSAMPNKITESGLGDVEGQIRWRVFKETERRPEVFTFVEAVIPHSKRKLLIGTPGVELKVGGGIIKGFNWGTMTFRGSAEYSAASDTKFDIGEFAVEYLKQISPKWRVFVGLEGRPDEFSVIPEIQWHFSKRAFLKVNSGFGLTSKAIDFAPEFGIVFRFP